MSPSRHDACARPQQPPTRERLSTLYWVIGGCYGDESRSWRRWSEVVGPFGRREAAEAQRARLSAIFARDVNVHFEVVRSDEDEGG